MEEKDRDANVEQGDGVAEGGFDLDGLDIEELGLEGIDLYGAAPPPDAPEGVPEEAKVKRRTRGVSSEAARVRMEIYDWLQCIVSAVVCGILIFIFVGRVIGVDGNSMLNTLHDGDSVVMSNLFYTPRYGDIVVIKTEAFGDEPIVKRVIATAGQTVDINFDTGEVMIDGNVIEEDYIREPTRLSLGFEGPVTVPEGCVFVMGDNRNESTDSRSSQVGFVDTRQILGKVLFVLIPGKDAGGARSWNRIGSVYR